MTSLLLLLLAPPDPRAGAGLLPEGQRWAAGAGCVRVTGGGDAGPVHPVKRLGEAGHREDAEIARKLLRPRLHPTYIVDRDVLAPPPGFSQHAGIGIDANGFGKEMRQCESHHPRPASDIDEPPRSTRHRER